MEMSQRELINSYEAIRRFQGLPQLLVLNPYLGFIAVYLGSEFYASIYIGSLFIMKLDQRALHKYAQS